MVVGVDIGSRAIKVVALDADKVLDFKVAESGFAPNVQAMEMIKEYHPEIIIATGYGRHLARKEFAHDVITEIKAHAIGAKYLFPECRTVIDIGGQDSKVIILDNEGNVKNFLMNDKCAAGTGRFLEIMAASLGFSLHEFGQEALKGTDTLRINSMCTVFAESEVISLKNTGCNPVDIAMAIHHSVADRVVAMAKRMGYAEDVVFSGGVARNKCLSKLLEEKLNVKVQVPSNPEIVGALGAALYGAQKVAKLRIQANIG